MATLPKIPALWPFLLLAFPGHAQTVLRANGSTTVAPILSDAADVLLARHNIRLQVDTLGGSSGGIRELGEGRVDIGMSSKSLSPQDLERHAKADLRPVAIGSDAVALVVSRDVWEGGVRALTLAQVRGLYEGRIRNWRELGGPDLRVAFFNKEPGRGTWEVFAAWAYGKSDKAPLVSLPAVGANREARAKVAGTPGAVTQLSASWADGETVFSLALVVEGEAIAPTAANIAEGRYPMRRPLYVLHRGEASGSVKTVVDFLLSPEGQAVVARHDYLPNPLPKPGVP